MLQVYKQDGLEIVIDNATGEAFATVRGYARMADMDSSTISRRAKGVASGAIKTAEIETKGGLQGVALIPADLIFDWALNDNPQLAKAMGKAGATVFLYQLAGYQVKPVESAQPKTTLELLRLHMTVTEEHDKRLAQLEQVTSHNEQAIAELKAEVSRYHEGHDGRHFTVVGYCNLKQISGMLRKDYAKAGKDCMSLMRRYGIEPQKVYDPKFGDINAYPISILDEVFFPMFKEEGAEFAVPEPSRPAIKPGQTQEEAIAQSPRIIRHNDLLQRLGKGRSTVWRYRQLAYDYSSLYRADCPTPDGVPIDKPPFTQCQADLIHQISEWYDWHNCETIIIGLLQAQDKKYGVEV